MISRTNIPPMLYKAGFFVYNRKEYSPNRLDDKYYTRFLCKINCRFG